MKMKARKTISLQIPLGVRGEAVRQSPVWPSTTHQFKSIAIDASDPNERDNNETAEEKVMTAGIGPDRARS